eukprot:2210850-Pyramimonas_sp.AAC.1
MGPGRPRRALVGLRAPGESETKRMEGPGVLPERASKSPQWVELGRVGIQPTNCSGPQGVQQGLGVPSRNPGRPRSEPETARVRATSDPVR